MRERNRFEIELIELGLRPVPAAVMDTPLFAFETAERREYEIPPLLVIQGGLYDEKKQKFEGTHESGLIRTTSPKIGREESRVIKLSPYTLPIGRKAYRFNFPELARWVADYNAFALHVDEVVRGIGRLRDLLSSGAPESPSEIKDIHRLVMRRTDDYGGSGPRKTAYEAWRKSQREYASVSDKGNVVKGALFNMIKAYAAKASARHDFWDAQEALQRTIVEIKGLTKPEYDAIDLHLSDVAGIITSEKAWWQGLLTTATVVIDWVAEARKNRKEYDEKMKQFKAAIAKLKGVHTQVWERYVKAGDTYWERDAAYQESQFLLNEARMAARRDAALFGQNSLPPGKKSDAVTGGVRMPPLMAEAWRVLAINGRPAVTHLNRVLAKRALIVEANRRMKRLTTDKYKVDDITNIVIAFKEAEKWGKFLTRDLVGTWQTMHRLWAEAFGKVYR